MSESNYYRVYIRQHIHGCFAGASSIDKFVKKEITLPFVPFKGINIEFGDWSVNLDDIIDENGGLVECIISYSLDENRFNIWMPSDKEMYYNDLLKKRERRTIDEIVDDYLENGWELET